MGPLSKEDFEEAKQLYAVAISGREASIGPDHPRCLYTVTNSAKLISECAPKPSNELFDEAEELHSRAVRKFVEKLHETHPLTLTSMHNQASHWMCRGRFVARDLGENVTCPKALAFFCRAQEQLVKVHQLRTEKLGQAHQDTTGTQTLIEQCRKANSKMSGQLAEVVSYSSWKELIVESFVEVNSVSSFMMARKRLRQYGIPKLRKELIDTGFVDEKTGKLTTGMQPFNVFARIAGGQLVQPNMAQEQDKLGDMENVYVLCCNRPECDEMWESLDPAWVGKASMSKVHKFLTVKDLSWEWFNILTFGVVSGLQRACALLESMREAALHWARKTDLRPERMGLYFHVYPFSSVSSLHMHILDMDNLGPTYHKLQHKNLPVEVAIAVLKEEIAATSLCDNGGLEHSSKSLCLDFQVLDSGMVVEAI